MASTIKLGGNTKRSKLGTFEVAVPAFAEMPAASQAFIVAYGLKQYLSDAMAGAPDRDAAQAAIDARVTKLETGDLTRTKGEAKGTVDSLEARTMKLIKAAIRAAMKAKGIKATKELVDEAAGKLRESARGEQFMAEAASQLMTESQLAEGDDDMDSLLADLMEPDVEDEEVPED